MNDEVLSRIERHLERIADALDDIADAVCGEAEAPEDNNEG